MEKNMRPLPKKPSSEERMRPMRPATRSKTQVWRARKETRPATESWGSVAKWYSKHLSGGDTYHAKVILPNLLRLINPQKDDTILDIACGTGYFVHGLRQKGVKMVGVDISEELIAIARKETPEATFFVAPADDLTPIASASIEKAMIILAIQNIEHIDRVFHEVSRVLKPSGECHIVMNHPAFRVPKLSSWQYDDKKKVQYRRIDSYMAESRAEMDMHPGIKDSEKTLSFHRPLQYYFKSLSKNEFAVDRMEEWVSHKESTSGPRALAENKARKNIPLFLYLRARKNNK